MPGRIAIIADMLDNLNPAWDVLELILAGAFPPMAQSTVVTGLDAATYRLVGSNRILRFLPPDDLDGLIRRSSIIELEARHPLFAQDDEGHTVLVVLKGYVKLSSTTLSGREAILDIAGPGSVFGELAVLNRWTRAASAMTLSSCRLLSIDGQQFVDVLERTPKALLATIRLLSERLRTATEQMTDAVDLPAPARVAKALIYLAALHSRPGSDGLRIEFQLSQRELGGLTGLTRESINKHLANFRDSGWIRLSGREIALLDLPALKQNLHDLNIH
jgi:CRP/FNR family transcriptional regulator